MTKDFSDSLAAFKSEGEGRVVIGGMALAAVIPHRTPGDLDVLIEPVAENGKRARRAVAAWGSCAG